MTKIKYTYTYGDFEKITTPLGTGEIQTSPCGNYYHPPYDLPTLGKIRTINPYHGSAITFRKNMLANTIITTPLPLPQFTAAAMDFYSYGYAALQIIKNKKNKILTLKHIPALNLRIGTTPNTYYYLHTDKNQNIQTIQFKPNEIIITKEYDPIQEIYGTPDWLGGIQSALLNDQATTFRRKYYKNGAHLGYILYTHQASMTEEDEKSIRQAIESGKGAGNFKTMHLHIPDGNEKSIQILPIGDLAQKDEFEKIKRITSEDVCAAHRVPPALMGIAPQNAGGFGAIDKIIQTYFQTEVKAATLPWLALNPHLPKNLQFKFNPTYLTTP